MGDRTALVEELRVCAAETQPDLQRMKALLLLAADDIEFLRLRAGAISSGPSYHDLCMQAKSPQSRVIRK
jgi:hypothetical protein